MAQPTPSPVRWILKTSRQLVNSIARTLKDPALLEATRRDLGLPKASSPTDVGAVNAKLLELEGKQQEFETEAGDDLALDERTVEFLVGGKRFIELIELMFPGRAADDPRTYGDIAYAFATIYGSEWLLRPASPAAWATTRFLMLGYEHVETVPRFDPFYIFDRLAGTAPRVEEQGFGAVEALGGIVIPIGMTLLNLFVASRTSEERLHERGLKKGDLYLAGALDFKVGWEAAPDAPMEVQRLMQRALSIGYTGKLKAYEEPHESDLTLILTAMALDAEDGGPGLLLRVGGAGKFQFETPSQGHGAIKTGIELELAGGPGIDFLWKTEPAEFKYLGSSASHPLIELAVESKGTEAVPALRIGKANASRFDLVAIKSGFAFAGDSAYAFIEFKNTEFVLDLAEVLPGPVGKVIGGAGAGRFQGRVDGKLKFDRDGLHFEGEAALKVRLASNAVNAGALRFDYLDLEASVGHGGFGLALMMAAHFELGPFAATVDRMGLGIHWKKEHGQLQEHFEFKPPKGIGLRIRVGDCAAGGGYLMLDYDKGEFAGAFELVVFHEFAIQVIVILTTKVPQDAAPYALFIAGNIRFPGGLEIGLGFKINGLGLLLGLHHGFDVAALTKALPSGAMDDVLFPKDIVGDAPRIINSVRTIFPIKAHSLTLGFMVELGWGSDYICSLRLGLVLPFDNVLGGERDPSLDNVVLLGRCEVVCFKALPKLIRIQIVCDFVGEVRFNPFAVSLLAQLRDSRIGAIAIDGSMAASIVTGSNPRFIMSAGGFHPQYKSIPQDFPAPLKRLAMTYDIGVIKAWVHAYFAIAPGSVQFGGDVGVRYAFGPLSFGVEFGLDVLIQVLPDFYFLGRAHGQAAVKFRGHTLMGVGVELTLSGPCRWRAKGRGTFTILFWDEDIEFDESWGREEEIERQRSNVAQLVLQDLNDRTHWRLELPQRGNSLVALAANLPADEGATMTAHPLSVLSFTQSRVPFGMELQRYGTAQIDGTRLFPVPQLVNDAGESLGTTQVLTEHFAISEYVDLPEDDRLSRPGFQPLPAGVATSSGGYILPAQPPKEAATGVRGRVPRRGHHPHRVHAALRRRHAEPLRRGRGLRAIRGALARQGRRAHRARGRQAVAGLGGGRCREAHRPDRSRVRSAVGGAIARVPLRAAGAGHDADARGRGIRDRIGARAWLPLPPTDSFPGFDAG